VLNQINIEYPENLPDVLQVTRESFEEEAKIAMAVKLFEMKRISSGMAAKHQFLRRPGKNDSLVLRSPGLDP